MSVFNSLGSNYDGREVWRSLLMFGSKKSPAKLRALLKKHYDGEAVLTYKGRQALELSLLSLGLPKGSNVGMNGFSCFVVYQAIIRAGLNPVFIDIAADGLDFSQTELERADSQTKLKAIIIQNTLGYPVDMVKIAAYCRQKAITIIEDLAHSFRAQYSDGFEAGTVGDLTMLSFSQDKPLDVVAGGALIDRRQKQNTPEVQPKKRVSHSQRSINGLYPFWTALIRGSYPIGLGRYIHFILKKLHLMATPMSDNITGLYAMEPLAASLALGRWDSQDKELSNRRAIAKIYQQNLPKDCLINSVAGSNPSYLRFAISVDDRASLVKYLKAFGIYIGDTWYDAPIGPKRYLAQTNYKTGQCPNAERLAEQIVNLPTHQHVSPRIARLIAEKVNIWLKQSV